MSDEFYRQTLKCPAAKKISPLQWTQALAVVQASPLQSTLFILARRFNVWRDEATHEFWREAL